MVRVVHMSALAGAAMWLGMAGCAALSGRPPVGAEQQANAEQQAAIAKVGEQVAAAIVWSTSRFGNHDLVMMRTDKPELIRLTQGETVDWFPRFSPDGKRILFIRSKKGWVSERDANRADKWNLHTIAADGSGDQMVVADATWGTWLSDEEILFSRGTKVVRRNLTSAEETVLVDSEQEAALGGAYLQQPQLSPDGRFIAITLRGGRRETGVWNLEAKTWRATGKGCQINWAPDNAFIYWVNPSGNGGSQVFRLAMTDGVPTDDKPKYSDEELGFIDIPGRRSHEYFPQLSHDGKWLVWAATQRGHDHDIADYEVYIWKVADPAEAATRLSFHSGNDRWPDIHLAPSAGDQP